MPYRIYHRHLLIYIYIYWTPYFDRPPKDNEELYNKCPLRAKWAPLGQLGQVQTRINSSVYIYIHKYTERLYIYRVMNKDGTQNNL